MGRDINRFLIGPEDKKVCIQTTYTLKHKVNEEMEAGEGEGERTHNMAKYKDTFARRRQENIQRDKENRRERGRQGTAWRGGNCSSLLASSPHPVPALKWSLLSLPPNLHRHRPPFHASSCLIIND